MAPRHQTQRLSKELPFHRDQQNENSFSDPRPSFTKGGPPGKASLEVLNENSPLLSAQRIEDDNSPLDIDPSVDELEYLDIEEQEESKSVWYLIVLTLSIGG